MSFPAKIELRCIGSGDAFGSGGRLNSCFHLIVGDQQILLDCGCSSLIGMERCSVVPAEIDSVIISHLHGDHFGGIPFLLLEGKYASQRSRPLTLIGPPGLQQRVETLANGLYPGLGHQAGNFDIEYRTLDPKQSLALGIARIKCFQMIHGGGNHAYGLRIEAAGKVISYTGDTEWTDTLIPLSQGSDLLIAECCAYDQPIPGHLDYLTVLKYRHKLETRRLVLTHMGPEMLKYLDQLKFPVANDGAVLEF